MSMALHEDGGENFTFVSWLSGYLMKAKVFDLGLICLLGWIKI